MALDEALLRAPRPVPTLRTYTWEPWTLSLGYFQSAAADRLAPFSRLGYGIVRRMTGGKAIFHGPELTYSVAYPLSLRGLPRTSAAAYDLFHGILARALGRLGVACSPRGDRALLSDTGDPEEFFCFYESSPFDLAAEGRKLVGSAQRRTARGLLQHGSVPTAPNPFTPEAAHAGTDPGLLEEILAETFGEVLGTRVVPAPPTDRETALARELEERRYARDEWTRARIRPPPPIG